MTVVVAANRPRRSRCPNRNNAETLAVQETCPQAKPGPTSRKEPALKVFVRDNNIDQALRVMKKKMQREGLFREMKRRQAYEKPSEKRVREKREGIRRVLKAARKLAQREGLIPNPDRKRRAFGGR